jgi:hypothetical protein
MSSTLIFLTLTVTVGLILLAYAGAELAFRGHEKDVRRQHKDLLS